MDKSNDIYAQAEAELSDIRGKIAALERRQERLRQFIALGRQLYEQPVEPLQPQLLPEPTVQRRLRSAPDLRLREVVEQVERVQYTMKHNVLTLSKQAIEAAGPQTTRALVNFIEEKGVEVTGADKPTTVSVILSRSPEFKNTRGVGWSLVPVQKELTP